MTEDADMARVERHCAQLEEHFDTVQIFCTRQGADGTMNLAYGSGNWFARRGQVGEWVIKQDETAKESCRGDR